jgi:hypothetical protein
MEQSTSFLWYYSYQHALISPSRKEPFRFRQRNFDPETRTLVKHSKVADENEDTVEKNIEGLADMIIAEDEEKRNQELVSLAES